MADKKPRNADFVGRVVGDVKNPSPVRLLQGWFGDSGEEGYRRLYTDPELTNWVDIPDDAILHTEPVENVQPAGCLLVWVKADAELKPGGSASGRAARFLQGQVQRDFSSPEKAGYRCVTQTPCAEPTGFTGQCTKQPEVGGGWPCITAIPHCAEPTGFTGKCTDQPWPNPTRYPGCTVYHCPTQDLTHVPWICNAIAQQPAAPQAQGDAGDAAAPPATNIPGCGYTQTWGLCDTQLLGCQQPQGGGGGGEAQVGAPLTIPPRLCAPTPATRCFICPPRDRSPLPWFCPPSPWFCTPPVSIGIACTVVQCGPRGGGGGPSAIDACPTGFCPPGGGVEQVGAAQAGLAIHPTPATRCFVCNPPTFSFDCGAGPQFAGATQAAQGGPTPATVCTQAGHQCRSAVDACPTRLCGGGGQFAQAAPDNTYMGPNCPTPATHCFVCPPFDIAQARGRQGGLGVTAWLDCTQFGPQCGQFFTLFAVQCEVIDPWQTRVECFTIPAQGCPPPPPPTPACPPPTPLCPPQSRLVVCTAIGPQCGGGGPILEQVGAAIPQEPTPATVCFICTQHPRYCAPPEAAFAAQRGVGPQLTDVLCPTVTILTPQCVINDNTRVACIPTQQGCPPPPPTPACPPPTPGCPTPACPPTPGPRCPSVFIACTVFEPQCPGGGIVNVQPAAAAAPGPFRTTFIDCFNHPTPATRCFYCPPPTFSNDCGFAQGGWPTPATRCRVCYPTDAAAAAPQPQTLLCTPVNPCWRG